MSSGQQFSLKWNNYSHHIVTEFEELRSCDDLTDVTLSCEGKRLKAHKILLSACSVYFKETFKENPCKHPVVILQGVSFRDLEAVVSFMYNGQLNISQDNLSSFLETAQLLQIKGLTDKYNLNASKSAEKKRSPAQSDTTSKTNFDEEDDVSVVNVEPPPKLPNIEIFEVSKGTSDSLNASSSSQRSLTPIPTPPPPKKKRIGPASFMKAISVQNQSETVFHQSSRTASSPSPSPSVNIHSASGSGVESGDESCSGAPGQSSNDVSASTGGLLNPETVILPSTSLGDDSQGGGIPSSESFSHGVVKIEEDEEEEDVVGIGDAPDLAYDKNNLSEDHDNDNDNSTLDVLDNVTVEEEPTPMSMPMPTIINSFNTASSMYSGQNRGVQILNGNFSSISNVNSNLNSNSTGIMSTPEESILPYEILNYPLMSTYFPPENRISAPVPAKNRVLLLRRKTAPMPMNVMPVPVSLPMMAQLPVSISGIQVQNTSVAVGGGGGGGGSFGIGGGGSGGGHTSRSHTNKRKSFAVPRVFDISELSESSTSPTRTPDAVDMESWHKCSLCDKRYKCRSSLDSHIKIHQGEIAKCDICGQTMSRMRDLKRHVATVHRGLLEDIKDPLLSLQF